MNTTFRSSACAFLPALLLTACSGAADTGVTDSTSSERVSTADEALRVFDAPGSLFTQTNAVEGNELVAYRRATDGTLGAAGRFATGGSGTGGGGLTAQGAIARDGRWLFVVNAGSDDVTTFDIASGTPVRVARTASGGTTPVSVTAHEGVVYVLNQGGAGGIAGFRVGARGHLDPIAGSAQPLSGPAVTATEVAFSPDGDTLIATERDGNEIDAYFVDVFGRAHAPTSNASNGAAPFGFSFTPLGELIVSEAAASAASAYAVLGEVHLASITKSIANTQKAACWLVVDGTGRFAYTANAGSGTLSSYRIGLGGRLSLDTAIAGDIGEGTHPVDMAFGANGKYLYALANAGTITAFRVDGGKLAPIATVDSLPTSVSGLVGW